MAEPFEQRDAIRDYIFPIVEVEPDDDGFALRTFRGTGFFLGNRNYGLTAAHVVLNAKLPLAALFVDAERRWRGYAVRAGESHPTEDIAAISLEPPGETTWRSIVRASGSWAGSSAQYFLFGYPEDTVLEIVDDAVSDIVRPRPDLVFSEGHIRRRVSDVPIRELKGSWFFELSASAGGGCSGSPLLLKRTGWHAGRSTSEPLELIGVYVGERVMSPDSRMRELFPGLATTLGYAVRIEAIQDWRPELLGGPSLLEESRTGAGPE